MTQEWITATGSKKQHFDSWWQSNGGQTKKPIVRLGLKPFCQGAVSRLG